jgi:predicted lipid-binding transport protein (Tim44 family)
MKKTTRSIALVITAAALISPLAFAQTEGQQPQAEAPSAQPENSQGMGGMMQGMQHGEMMPMMTMMTQMNEMMGTCTKMMQASMDQDGEKAN